ncbi:Hypothetical predicted protein [Xyrichtys novacula]|uniref:Uncharacterized protein n=1 Tax=Xyrichtys novacula TaxID=13765 RepID=A0AAV1EYI3_XYRNO|nr:Hypothetical predicted protein [Xyrichtys novacula]
MRGDGRWKTEEEEEEKKGGLGKKNRTTRETLVGVVKEARASCSAEHVVPCLPAYLCQCVKVFQPISRSFLPVILPYSTANLLLALLHLSPHLHLHHLHLLLLLLFHVSSSPPGLPIAQAAVTSACLHS